MISGNFVTIGSMVLWKLERHPAAPIDVRVSVKRFAPYAKSED
jgi:hypothetical protein